MLLRQGTSSFDGSTVVFLCAIKEIEEDHDMVGHTQI
jgi:hypothetical protein